ncbi:MAG: glycoside hydrolase family 3 N-terminal domain-containing protein, partial [Methyloligellaceae bacterium]
SEMRAYGFNLNFGPVLDLNINPRNPIIAGRRRSFGNRPELVTAFAQAFISAHRDAGVLTAGKHFPGHGSSLDDSHRRLVDLTASWNEAELDPYRVLAGRKMLDMVMVGHLFHPVFSPQGRVPATYSNIAIGKILRGQVGYKGVVVTDDLAMQAAANGYTMRQRLIRSIQAGNDILLITKGPALRPGFAGRAISAIRKEVESGRLTRKRISESYQRILAMKRELLSRQKIMRARTRNQSEARN